MFSGIVDHFGSLMRVESLDHQSKFWIQSNFTDLALGESVAVDGVCLTVVDTRADQFACVLSPETLGMTVAGHYQVGQQMNLERALCFTDRISGHLVTGHVDAVICVRDIQYYDECTSVLFSLPSSEEKKYLVKKGSVTINGVSLTVNLINENEFGVMLIPHTIERTNLSELSVGSSVNLEWDYIAKCVASYCDSFVTKQTQDKEEIAL